MRRLAATAVALVAVGAACSGDSRLDDVRTETAVRDRLSEAFDAEVTEVRCPSDIDVEEGLITLCEADLEAGTMTVQVVQTDDDGTVAVTPNQALIVTERIEADAAAELSVRYRRDDVTVTCPGPAEQLLEPDATFTCEADDGDDQIDVVVRVRDAWGAVAYTLDG